ncbi:MAG: aminopeptidase P family protein [Alphaproteobacteria bacterium]|nr:aminopeptidase P family protein [Alphaproteobacteria bacterium]
MPLHFSTTEFTSRKSKLLTAMAAAELDGLLMFKQESMFYLTGYDSFGFVFFQCLVLGADGRFTLLTRAPDLRQAQHTSILDDIRIWVDRAGATPAEDLKDVLRSRGLLGKRLGIELEAYGLTGRSLRMVDAALADACTLEDASSLVDRLRLVKSPAELAIVRRAAVLADDSWDAAIATTKPGAFEGDIQAAMQSAVLRGDGDPPANDPIIGSGRGALLCRYFTGRRRLDPEDQLMLEFAGSYRHYHAAMMRTICVGRATDRHRTLHRACVEALGACQDALRPGRPIGEVFDAHARVMDKAGLKQHRLNACGYSMGATFAPVWMDWPMFFHGNPVLAEPDMTFFLHMILMDSDSGTAMALGHSVAVTGSGCQVLSRSSTDLVVA